MAQTATVNYHVHKPDRQAFELDAGGIIGNQISPDLAPTLVQVLDVRQLAAGMSFKITSVGFTTAPTQIRAFGDDKDWQQAYDDELTKLLASEIGAQEVLIFDHTLRMDDPHASRKPARNAHSDYSLHGAKQRLIDIPGADKAAMWSKGH